MDDTPEAENLETKPKLPAHAKPINRKYEEHAHLAAKFIRETGLSRPDALREVAKERGAIGSVSIATAEMQVRRTFDMMYLPDGSPIKKDQK